MALGSLGSGLGQPRVLARSLRLQFQRFRTADAAAAAPKGGLGTFTAFPNLRASGTAGSRVANFERVFSTGRAFGRDAYYGRIAQARIARTVRVRTGLFHRIAGIRR